MSERHVVIILDEPGQRLDKALAKAIPELSRTQCQRLIKDGRVRINGHKGTASQRLEGGESLEIFFPESRTTELIPQPIPIDIIYEDEDLLLVDKPAGMVVHPAAGHDTGTLVNAILAHCPDLHGVSGEKRPGIVHRLDKETSGLILVAKNDNSLRYLQQQFKERSVSKAYLALVEGHFSQREALIDAPIGRDPRDRKRMAVIPPETSARSREAQTRVNLLTYAGAYSLLDCQPLTGRTHQIRVHLAFAGYPIVGDVVYGRRRQQLPFERHFLHAAKLGFNRPSDGSEMVFSSPLPDELQAMLDELER